MVSSHSLYFYAHLILYLNTQTKDTVVVVTKNQFRCDNKWLNIHVTIKSCNYITVYTFIYIFYYYCFSSYSPECVGLRVFVVFANRYFYSFLFIKPSHRRRRVYYIISTYSYFFCLYNTVSGRNKQYQYYNAYNNNNNKNDFLGARAIVTTKYVQCTLKKYT